MVILPIGTVVRLQGGTKKIMIYGINVKNLDDGKDYDYVACLYPEGYIADAYNIFFNSGKIDKIYYYGYKE